MWKNCNKMMVRRQIINQYDFKWVNRVIFKSRTKRLSYDLTQTVTQPETTLSRKQPQLHHKSHIERVLVLSCRCLLHTRFPGQHRCPFQLSGQFSEINMVLTGQFFEIILVSSPKTHVVCDRGNLHKKNIEPTSP